MGSVACQGLRFEFFDICFEPELANSSLSRITRYEWLWNTVKVLNILMLIPTTCEHLPQLLVRFNIKTKTILLILKIHDHFTASGFRVLRQKTLIQKLMHDDSTHIACMPHLDSPNSFWSQETSNNNTAFTTSQALLRGVTPSITRLTIHLWPSSFSLCVSNFPSVKQEVMTI